MMNKNKNKNTFQFFKQRLDEAITRFTLDSQDVEEGEHGHDFFLRFLQEYSRFNWKDTTRSKPQKSRPLHYGIEGESYFYAMIDTKPHRSLKLDINAVDSGGFHVLLTHANEEDILVHRHGETIFEKNIETADKVALVFIKNIDEIVKRYFQSKAKDVHQMKQGSGTMSRDILDFDQ